MCMNAHSDEEFAHPQIIKLVTPFPPSILPRSTLCKVKGTSDQQQLKP